MKFIEDQTHNLEIVDLTDYVAYYYPINLVARIYGISFFLGYLKSNRVIHTRACVRACVRTHIYNLIVDSLYVALFLNIIAHLFSHG